MDRKRELLRIERERWVQFCELVDRVPADRIDEQTLNPDGWSVKDLLWHIGSWDAEIAGELKRVRLGTYLEHDWDTDATNARFFEEGRRTDLATVRDVWREEREHVLAEMTRVDEVTPPVEEWFSESAYKHMDDHLPELRRFVEEAPS